MEASGSLTKPDSFINEVPFPPFVSLRSLLWGTVMEPGHLIGEVQNITMCVLPMRSIRISISRSMVCGLIYVLYLDERGLDYYHDLSHMRAYEQLQMLLLHLLN